MDSVIFYLPRTVTVAQNNMSSIVSTPMSMSSVVSTPMSLPSRCNLMLWTRRISDPFYMYTRLCALKNIKTTWLNCRAYESILLHARLKSFSKGQCHNSSLMLMDHLYCTFYVRRLNCLITLNSLDNMEQLCSSWRRRLAFNLGAFHD